MTHGTKNAHSHNNARAEYARFSQIRSQLLLLTAAWLLMVGFGKDNVKDMLIEPKPYNVRRILELLGVAIEWYNSSIMCSPG